MDFSTLRAARELQHLGVDPTFSMEILRLSRALRGFIPTLKNTQLFWTLSRCLGWPSRHTKGFRFKTKIKSFKLLERQTLILDQFPPVSQPGHWCSQQGQRCFLPRRLVWRGSWNRQNLDEEIQKYGGDPLLVSGYLHLLSNIYRKYLPYNQSPCIF